MRRMRSQHRSNSKNLPRMSSIRLNVSVECRSLKCDSDQLKNSRARFQSLLKDIRVSRTVAWSGGEAVSVEKLHWKGRTKVEREIIIKRRRILQCPSLISLTRNLPKIERKQKGALSEGK